MQSIGIDFGATTIKTGLCEDAKILSTLTPLETTQFSSPEATIDAIANHIENLRKSHPNIAAVGIGVPGNVQFDRGFVDNLTNVPGWTNVPLRDLLEKKTGLPAIAENDANCMAYAEWRHGAGENHNNMLAITLGTGVGGGLVLNGQFHHGANSVAGEVGQMSIAWNGRPGVYGNRGCLEQYIGHRQLTEHAAELYNNAGTPCTPNECSPKNLAKAANNNDPIALQLWDEFADMLACALCNVCWLVNPNRIVIGGGIAGAGDVLFNPLRKKIAAQLSQSHLLNLEIVPARFGNDAGILGAATIAADHARQITSN